MLEHHTKGLHTQHLTLDDIDKGLKLLYYQMDIFNVDAYPYESYLEIEDHILRCQDFASKLKHIPIVIENLKNNLLDYRSDDFEKMGRKLREALRHHRAHIESSMEHIASRPFNDIETERTIQGVNRSWSEKGIVKEFSLYDLRDNAEELIDQWEEFIDELMPGLKEGQRILESMTDEKLQEVLNTKYSEYKAEHEGKLENIFDQDYIDNKLEYGEAEAYNILLADRRKKLFDNEPFGVEFHDCGRSWESMPRIIISYKQKNYDNIFAFFRCYLEYEIAERKLEEYKAGIKNAPTYRNLIFREELNSDLIFQKLEEYLDDKTLSVQRQWCIAHQVFKEKKWLEKTAFSKFSEQIILLFEKKLKVTKADYKEYDNYFKHNKTEVWDSLDPQAPQCAEDYIKLANKLNMEFVDNKYLLPGRFINRRQ